MDSGVFFIAFLEKSLVKADLIMSNNGNLLYHHHQQHALYNHFKYRDVILKFL